MLLLLLKLLVFPGLLFMLLYSMLLEYIDRKVYARLQNRVGPPWYQPLADYLKLMGKGTIIPAGAKAGRFRMLPILALTAVTAAFVYVPVIGPKATYAFEGDLIIVLYFSMLPAMVAFLAGWYSRSIYATMGSTRKLTQLFSYEVPLFVATLTPALVAESWSISEIALFYSRHPLLLLLNLPAFLVCVVAVQGKLDRVPFDQSEAETEVVSGVYVEYSGRFLAFFRMTADCETVLMLSVVAAIFFPFYTGVAWADTLLYFVKTGALMLVVTLIRSAVARLRMEQMAAFYWKIVTPAALLVMLAMVIVRGLLL